MLTSKTFLNIISLILEILTLLVFAKQTLKTLYFLPRGLFSLLSAHKIRIASVGCVASGLYTHLNTQQGRADRLHPGQDWYPV